MRAKLWLGIGVVVASTFAGGAPAAKPSGRCNRHSAYRHDRDELVFRVHTRSYPGVDYPVTVYNVCARPNGKSVQLALDDTSWRQASTPGDYVLAAMPLAGSYAGAEVLRNVGSAEACARAAQPTCPSPYVELTLVEARSRSKARLTSANGVKSLTLSPAGAAAWLVRVSSGGWQLMATGLHPQGRQLRISPRSLDTGNITDMRFSGLRLSWRNGGTPRSATLM